MVNVSYKTLYHPYVIIAFILIFIGIEFLKNGRGNNSLLTLFNGSKSSNYNILAFFLDKVGFYFLTLNFLSFGLYGEFKGLLGSLALVKSLELPIWFSSILCLLTIDLSHYWLHRLYHRFNWLYNFHSFHHSAKEMSIFIVYRDHILEYLLKSRFILLIIWGPSHSLFFTMVFRDIFLLTNHMRWDSNWGVWGKVFVSPYFHKVHHNQRLMGHNFGAIFSFWDRLFKTEYKGEKIDSLEIRNNEFYNRNYLVAYLVPIVRFLSLGLLPKNDR